MLDRLEESPENKGSVWISKQWPHQARLFEPCHGMDSKQWPLLRTMTCLRLYLACKLSSFMDANRKRRISGTGIKFCLMFTAMTVVRVIV